MCKGCRQAHQGSLQEGDALPTRGPPVGRPEQRDPPVESAPAESSPYGRLLAVLRLALLQRRAPSMHWLGQPSKLIRPFRVWLVALVLLIGGAGCPRPTTACIGGLHV